MIFGKLLNFSESHIYELESICKVQGVGTCERPNLSEAWCNEEDCRANHPDVGSNFGSALSFGQKWRQYLPHKVLARIKVNENISMNHLIHHVSFFLACVSTVHGSVHIATSPCSLRDSVI